MSDYVYTISTDTANGVVDLDLLETAVLVALPDLGNVSTLDDVVTFYFADPLTGPEEADLTTILGAHTGDSLAPYKALIENAIAFFSEIMVIYAAENITMGITYYGKTKEVSDYLTDVLRYGQTGSLYEVIDTIDNLVAEGIPAELSPFVTDVRLTLFKDKILEYIS